MTLKDLFPTIEFSTDITIHNIQNDSRHANKDTLFVAFTGFEIDVHDFIDDAYQHGCRYFLVAQDRFVALQDSYRDALFIPSVNLKEDMSQVILKFYNYPDKELVLIGITGTNGKTTTATLINQSLQLMGAKTACFGTVEWVVGDIVYPAPNTTPDFLTLIKLLRQAIDQKVTHVIMEVASHALDLGRVENLNFDCALFTNLTQDHLDYHGTFEKYYRVKSQLFLKLLAQSCKKNKKSFVNADDLYGQRLLKELGERGIPTTSLSIEGQGVWNATNINLTINNTEFTLSNGEISIAVNSNLLGMINVQNIMMAFVLLRHLGYSDDNILFYIPNITILGRLQKVHSPKGVVFLVDYAHTPDALEKVISVVNNTLSSGKKSIVVFGAGGDRDTCKRPLMAQATKNAHIKIVTSDNPRTEDPKLIIQDIMRGFDSMTNIYQEIDRVQAIRLAYQKADQGDVILVAGKGHENYQIIGKSKIHFSDIEEIQKLL